jgi:hypothetical protein
MTARKFYRIEIQVVVISEEPVNFDDLYGVHLAITEGDCSGRWRVNKRQKLNGKQTAKALRQQGSDPGFMRLDDAGNDYDE